MCISALAEHTKNLLASPRASILVTDAAEGVDPLASGRMTLVGPCARVADDQLPGARATFLAAHPEAAGYATFADFAMWRLDVEGVWWVGGFGRMEWIPPADLAVKNDDAARHC
jgi:putative heme iron utilization protein